MPTLAAPSRRADFTGQAVAAGVSSAILGYASSISLVIIALTKAGATSEQVSSGLLALGISMAVVAVGFSAGLRIPVSIAWSTPGAALMAGVGAVDGGYPATIGALVLTGLLIALTGLIRPLNRLILQLPTPLTAAVLAGVVLPFCLQPARAVTELPVPAGAIVVTWLVVLWLRPAWASAAALAALVVIAVLDGTAGSPTALHLDPTTPSLTWQAVVQIALPLYVVTMAAQNLVGVAVLTTFGYRPPVGRILVATGAGSAAGGLFGGMTINLAAITGALTAGPNAHPDPDKRWVAVTTNGLTHLLLGALAPVAAGIVTRTDPALVGTAAGLALVMTFVAAAKQALDDEDARVPAAVTLLVTASGMTALGVGAAPWGLLLGGVLLALKVGRPEKR
ncbi:benzoate/H(+) symporter BenE family transporter [Spongisporangium articulatum]|uniref:Benzoate/H(+) symporter BenE family transporter n=1 Tax=Spongisporangium articulatum TaxID=3362603 RepID=A0ABW8ARR2_9ACTN